MKLVDREIIQKQYDRYVQFYNASSRPIAAYSEFLTIKNGLQQRLKEIKDNIDLYVDDIEIYLGEIYDSTISSEGDKSNEIHATNHNNLIENIVNHIKWEVQNFSHIYHSEDFIKHNSQQIKMVYEAYNQNGQEQNSMQALAAIVRSGKKYEQAYYHLKGIKAVAANIIDEDYPTTLKDYVELEEQERNEILDGKRPGANPKKEVPQAKIEELVQECIKDKSNRRFVHQSGKQKGKANQSQIYEFIESNYPIMVKGLGAYPDKGAVKRTIIRRIVKALPDDMT